MEKKKNGLVTGMIIGGAVASVAGILLSKKENREKIKRGSGDFITKLKHWVNKRKKKK